MAYKDKSKAVAYNNNFIKETYDRVNLTLPKGKKEMLQAHAEKFDGGSVNKFINRAINTQIELDQSKSE